MKKLISIIFSMLLITTLVGAKTYKLQLSHQMAKTHTLNMTAEKFASIVKERTNGDVIIEVFPSASLGTERENAEALKTGTLDMAIIAVEFYPSYVKEASVLILPYMYKDYDHLKRVLESPAAEEVSEMITEKTNIKILTYLAMAFRQMFTVEKPIKSANDLKGVKMRVPESPLYVAALKQFGASPTPIAWGEVYTALQTGVVKGVENTPEAVSTNSLNEVTKYMNLTNHMTAPTTISISQSVFKKLPNKYQDILISAAQEAAKFNFDLTVSRDKEYREKLKDTLTIIQPDVSSFKKAIKYDEIDLVSSDKAKKLIKELEKIK